jgi:O-antigen ligase
VKFLLALLLAFATATVFLPQAWPLQSFQIGAYLLLAVCLIARPRVPLSWVFLPILGIPLWGLVQLTTHSTASTAETRAAVLRWGALAAVFLVSWILAQRQIADRAFLESFMWFAVAVSVLCLTQLFTSQGRVLWLFDSGHFEVFGTFQNRNNFAQFVELALPIALWSAIASRRRAVYYALAAGALYASVIASASRTGALMCTLELTAVLVIGLLRLLRGREAGSRPRRAAVMLAIVPILAVVFTLVAGWDRMWNRFQDHDPFSTRREFLAAAVDMIEQRPLIGFGLGTFPEVYQRYAVRDFPFYANHVHNDWAEFAAEGGIPFLLLIFVPFALAVPTAIRHPWALGLVAVMLHACVDFPFPRPAVSGWMFALLGMLYACRSEDQGLGGRLDC